jgi:tetratricopeptide (TPR) repeat protein
MKAKRQRRCIGITPKFGRCGRVGEWRCYCDDHKYQPIKFIIYIIVVLVPTFYFYNSCSAPSLDALYKRAVAYEEVSQVKNALQLFEKLYEAKPDYPTVAYHYGRLLKESGNLEMAITVLNSVPSNEPHIDLEYMKGWLYYQLNNFNKAKVSISNAKRVLTPNDNRYYLAEALFIIITNNDNRSKLYASALDFCELVDGILEMERTKSTTHPKIPESELERFINKTMALRVSAFFILTKAIESEYKEKNYHEVIFLFNRAIRYLYHPWDNVLKYTEQNFCNLLEVLSISLCNLNVSNYSSFEETQNSLENLENKNRDKNRRISEMAFLMNAIYFGTNKDRVFRGEFSLVYQKDISSSEPIYKVIIKFPESLSGEEVHLPQGSLKYTYERVINVSKGSMVRVFNTLVTLCNKTGGCSQPVKIYPFVKAPIYKQE